MTQDQGHASPALPTSLAALPASPAMLGARLLDWYDRHRRDLPWRAAPGASADPYAILVSEQMLQQTTVATARPRFVSFLGRFPDVETLAAADLSEVLHEWQGLGYYRRARSLHACARLIVSRHGGRLPADREALLALPGIGPYTADAVAAIAFGRPRVPLDGNVKRVLARLAAIEAPIESAGPALEVLADVLAQAEAPAGRCGDLAQAVMELGALCCTPRKPDCPACPWIGACRARAAGTEAALPRRAPRKTRPEMHATAFLLRRADGAVLFRRRPETGMLAGLVELPATAWSAAPPISHEIEAAAPAHTTWLPLDGRVTHVFTHLKLHLHLLRGEAEHATAGFWQPADRLDELALPTLTRKLLRHGGVRG